MHETEFEITFVPNKTFKAINEMLPQFGLGVDEIVLTDTITIRTDKKPNKKQLEVMKKAITKAFEKDGGEVKDVTIIN